jgi:two-component sensor histidine kinase
MPDSDETRVAGLHQQRRQLEAQVEAQACELNLLRARFARYETVLRGSQVTVCTQDRDLRYTSISGPMFDRAVEDLLGWTDEQIFPSNTSANIVAEKREALATGQPKRMEITIPSGSGTRCFDLRIEPLRDDTGTMAGLTCAYIDVTERKEGEAHLRLLLRELTHRSKNLLAVIQAMARQTARHAGSIDAFLTQFGSRLQALAVSHDILVRESWYGASLRALVCSQLATHIDRGQVALDGPEIGLKPEAAQNLGLALHELVINAARFGALSVPSGRVSIDWALHNSSENNAIEINWREQFGPEVKPRRNRGFGSVVIERNLARALDAEIKLDFDPDGVRCHIVIPESQVVAVR